MYERENECVCDMVNMCVGGVVDMHIHTTACIADKRKYYTMESTAISSLNKISFVVDTQKKWSGDQQRRNEKITLDLFYRFLYNIQCIH